MASENTPNGELYAVISATVVTLLLVAIIATVAYLEKDNITSTVAILIGVGGFILSIFSYFIFEWLFMMIFWPGDTELAVGPSED